MGDINIYEALGLGPGDQAQMEGWLAEIRASVDAMVADIRKLGESEEFDPFPIMLGLIAAARTEDDLYKFLGMLAELVYRSAFPREALPPL